MMKNRKVWRLIGLGVFLCGFAWMSDDWGTYYRMSQASVQEKRHKVYPNQIVSVSRSGYKLLFQSANVMIDLEKTGKERLSVNYPETIPFYNKMKRIISSGYYDKENNVIPEPGFYVVEMIIKAKRKGLQFDPKEITLVMGQAAYKPIGYLSPPAGRVISQAGTINVGNLFWVQPVTEESSGEWTELKNLKTNTVPIPLEKGKNYFSIVFDRSPPVPGTVFDITIDGIYLDGVKDGPIKIHYQDEKEYYYCYPG